MRRRAPRENFLRTPLLPFLGHFFILGRGEGEFPAVQPLDTCLLLNNLLFVFPAILSFSWRDCRFSTICPPKWHSQPVELSKWRFHWTFGGGFGGRDCCGKANKQSAPDGRHHFARWAGKTSNHFGENGFLRDIWRIFKSAFCREDGQAVPWMILCQKLSHCKAQSKYRHLRPLKLHDHPLLHPLQSPLLAGQKFFEIKYDWFIILHSETT